MAIARALVNRPALLLADEPTGALDSAAGQQIGELLAGLNGSGQTLVLVTHNPDLAASLSTRIIRLTDGQAASDRPVAGVPPADDTAAGDTAAGDTAAGDTAAGDTGAGDTAAQVRP